MDLTQDLLVALSKKTPEQIQQAIDIADSKVREVVKEVKPEWPVVAVVDEKEVKIPQEWPVPVREALAEMAVQVLSESEIVEPEGLREAIISTEVTSKI